MTGKVFVLSLHRCGTRSTDRLLRDLGYSTVHWGRMVVREKPFAGLTRADAFAAFLPVLGRFDGFSDVPFNCFFEDLDRTFPDARFLLLTRDVEGWIRSVRDHIGDRGLSPFEALQYGLHGDIPSPYITDWTDAQLGGFHEAHIRAVRRHFASRPGKLLVRDLHADAGPAICAFLGADAGLALPDIG